MRRRLEEVLEREVLEVSVSLPGFPIYFGLHSMRKELGALW